MEAGEKSSEDCGKAEKKHRDYKNYQEKPFKQSKKSNPAPSNYEQIYDTYDKDFEDDYRKP
jgi:hypothetical protein